MTDDCIFCKIVSRHIPTTFLYEDEHLVAFKDIRPLAPVHLLVVPKQHVPTVADLPPGDPTAGRLVDCANRLAREAGVGETGYRLQFNCGPDGGQVVYHLHLHLLGGQRFA